MVATVDRALKTHFCGVLVFDEIQRLNFGQKQASERVRGLMLRLLNTGVPLVLAGNPRGLQFKGKDGESAQLTRRLTASGEFRLDPADSPDDPDWDALVRGLWRCQFLPEREKLTTTHQALIYQATGGFPVCLAHLLGYSQQLALSAGESKITLERLEQAADSCPMLKSMRSLIRGVVERDPLLLAKHEDVDAEYFQRKWQAKRGRTTPVSVDAPSDSARKKTARAPKSTSPIQATRRQQSSLDERSDVSPPGKHLLDQVDALIKKAKDAGKKP